jgi:hypothetical protein
LNFILFSWSKYLLPFPFLFFGWSHIGAVKIDHTLQLPVITANSHITFPPARSPVERVIVTLFVYNIAEMLASDTHRLSST